MNSVVVWFRQDLRLTDNPALHAAIKTGLPIIFLYIEDNSTSNKWPMGAAQQWWLHHSLKALEESLRSKGSRLILRRGSPAAIFKKMIREHNVKHVFFNRCYEPYALKRDKALQKTFPLMQSFKGFLLAEPDDVRTRQGGFFKVYTPFYKQFRRSVSIGSPLSKPTNWVPYKKTIKSETFSSMKWVPKKPNWARSFDSYWQPGEAGANKALKKFIKQHLATYSRKRDFPAVKATSRLSPYLHLGNISPRQIWQAVYPKGEKFLSEIVWREFAYHVLYHFPSLPEKNMNEKFNAFPWKKSQKNLIRWKQGKTGYPLVDAGMRELWHTGVMHNRVRMISASFLVKDLLLPWREGQKWFWDTLLDADLASNAFGWQWVAGSGADAAPFFRIFNPTLQAKKFDPQGEYILRWLPELKNVPLKYIHTPWLFEEPLDYPLPIVDHDAARKKALQIYQKIKK